jgi:HD-GYP domain-containing protein (c-di-GMP phosphodiesterase class II)
MATAAPATKVTNGLPGGAQRRQCSDHVNVTVLQPKVRLAEVIAPLSLATDLAGGVSLEHGLRRTLLAVWLAQELQLPEAEMSDVYYVALLGTVGCSVEGTLLATVSRDELAVLADSATVDPTSTRDILAWVLRNFGADEPAWTRLRILASALRSGQTQFQLVCRDVAGQVGDMLDIGHTTREALAQCHERWDGRGGPRRLKGEDIALPARIFNLAHHVDLFHRAAGIDAALAILRRGSGRIFDPQLAEQFLPLAPVHLSRLEAASAWDLVLEAEPEPWRSLEPSELEAVAEAMANVADIRSPYTVGHSRGVAVLAEAAARELRLSHDETTTIRRAGLLHDLGRCGVPTAVWDKAGPLTARERTRIESHPALTELVLARSSALGPLGMLAGLHHERIDGSGYRRVPVSLLPVAAQVLAAADAYRTRVEPRPHRRKLSPAATADSLRAEARDGRWAPQVVEAVLGAAGHQSEPITALGGRPAGLTVREIEVLRLVAQGRSNREVAELLVLAPKTVDHHIQHIYDKIGVSTRVGATLFALRHDLLPPGA